MALEREDHERDAAFSKALHGDTTGKEGGLFSMLGKDAKAQKAAVDGYYEHWDGKATAEETESVKEVSERRF